MLNITIVASWIIKCEVKEREKREAWLACVASVIAHGELKRRLHDGIHPPDKKGNHVLTPRE